jgi:hypothetical protein
MIHPETWKATKDILSGIWAVAGPLTGLLVGAYITNRNQRRSWVADNTRVEYRELLGILVEAMANALSLQRAIVGFGPEDQRKFEDIDKKVGITLLDRIFIARAVTEMKLPDRWAKAIAEYHNTGNNADFAEQVGEIRKDLTESAIRCLE